MVKQEAIKTILIDVKVKQIGKARRTQGNQYKSYNSPTVRLLEVQDKAHLLIDGVGIQLWFTAYLFDCT